MYNMELGDCGSSMCEVGVGVWGLVRARTLQKQEFELDIC